MEKKQNFVTHEIALKLDKLGFDEECFAGYDAKGELWYPSGTPNVTFSPRVYKKKSLRNKHMVKAPLWQEAVLWIKENHDIFIQLTPYKAFKIFKGEYDKNFKIFKGEYDKNINIFEYEHTSGEYRTAYHTIEAGVLKAIEIIENE